MKTPIRTSLLQLEGASLLESFPEDLVTETVQAKAERVKPSEVTVGSWKRKVIIYGVTTVVACALTIPVLRYLSRLMLYPAPSVPALSVATRRGDVEVHELPAGAEAWLLAPLRRNSRSPKAPVLVFTHGNGELIDHWLDDFKEPRRWGMAVLLVEYPGYGRSRGKPSEASITATMEAAHDMLSERDDIDESKIVAYGRSLGGGAATLMARKRPVAALILESTFTSVTRVAEDMGFPALFVVDPFDNESVVESFPGPILGIHGTSDRVIPYRHAQALQKKGKNYRLLTLSCGHNDCPRSWSEIRAFLRSAQIL